VENDILPGSARRSQTEKLIATSILGHGQKTRPDLIRQVVDAC
jgi:hypothetical protein